MDAMDADYDYASIVNPTITNHIDSSIEQGDIGSVFDSDADVIRDLNESIKKRKIIITESQLSKIEEDALPVLNDLKSFFTDSRAPFILFLIFSISNSSFIVIFHF